MANFKMGSQTVFTQTDDNTPVFNTSVKYTAGEIVQVQYSGEMTTTYDFNTAAYIHATQLDVSITPKFSNSLNNVNSPAILSPLVHSNITPVCCAVCLLTAAVLPPNITIPPLCEFANLAAPLRTTGKTSFGLRP